MTTRNTFATSSLVVPPQEEIVKNLMAAGHHTGLAMCSSTSTAQPRVEMVSSRWRCRPTLAADTDATVAEARDWVRADQPSQPAWSRFPPPPKVYAAIRRLIGEGISVNVTLIFSLERYREVIDAYLAGLGALSRGGWRPVDRGIGRFVLRFPVRQRGRPSGWRGIGLRLKLGLYLGALRPSPMHELPMGSSSTNSQAPLATGEVAAKGAHPQKPLWASTSTKNPAYSDLLYVENLVAPNSINTMPLDTIEAYQDHGRPRSGHSSPSSTSRRLGPHWTNLSDVGVELRRCRLHPREGGC